jgi:CheY-like chemotaxis protein
VGVGSQFTFTLPIISESETTPPEDRPLFRDKLETISKTLPWMENFIDQSEKQNHPQNPILEEPIIENNLLETVADLEAVSEERFIGEKFKILIVDDEPVNLQVLVNQLSLQNYKVTQASSGSEALELVEKGFNPDLILLDVMMPRMTGYEVCQQLRKNFPGHTIAGGDVNGEKSGVRFGSRLRVWANDYLSKPIFKNELLARI